MWNKPKSNWHRDERVVIIVKSRRDEIASMIAGLFGLVIVLWLTGFFGL